MCSQLVLPCAVTHSCPQVVSAVQNMKAKVSLQAYAQQDAEAQTRLPSHIGTQKAAVQERPGAPAPGSDAGPAATGPAGHAAAEGPLEVRWEERSRFVSSHGKAGPAEFSELCWCCGLPADMPPTAELRAGVIASRVWASKRPLLYSPPQCTNRVLISSKRQHKTSSLQQWSCLMECSKQLADSHT